MNEGMPLHRDPQTKGKLLIKYTVKFPTSEFAAQDQLKALRKLLPKPEKQIIPDGAERHVLMESDGRGLNRDEEYEQNYHAGPGVQCRSS